MLFNSVIFVAISELIVVAVTPVVSIFSDSMQKYWIWFAIIFLGYNLQQILSQYVKGIGKTSVFAVSGVVHTVVLIASNIIGLLFLKLGLNAYHFFNGFGICCSSALLNYRWPC